MRLSEAIREGSKQSYQCFNVSRTYDGGACAMSAARDGLGLSVFDIMPQEIKDIIGSPQHECPLCQCVVSVGGCIVHLNDRHRMTREAIAEWVEVQENKMPQYQPKPVEVVGTPNTLETEVPIEPKPVGVTECVPA